MAQQAWDQNPVYRTGKSVGERVHRVSFNGKLRDELLNGEIFTMLLEEKILLENWISEYNQIRPHSSLGNTPPAPVTVRPFYIPDTGKSNSGSGTITGSRSVEW